ncbi:hypothetical protein GCM10010238_31110 [Streptomyces griseoviridis]|uniref:Uncharacterized protein n=1 Tax=Streptomyces griseoviridis TaxID=45398 RepID=A0A918GKN8_STRGD|nr:hypothetical protein GCM10010238_31110 [Streptomyces niveoruber]
MQLHGDGASRREDVRRWCGDPRRGAGSRPVILGAPRTAHQVRPYRARAAPPPGRTAVRAAGAATTPSAPRPASEYEGRREPCRGREQVRRRRALPRTLAARRVHRGAGPDVID